MGVYSRTCRQRGSIQVACNGLFVLIAVFILETVCNLIVSGLIAEVFLILFFICNTVCICVCALCSM